MGWFPAKLVSSAIEKVTGKEIVAVEKAVAKDALTAAEATGGSTIVIKQTERSLLSKMAANPGKVLLGGLAGVTAIKLNFGSEEERQRAARDPVGAIMASLCGVKSVISGWKGGCGWTTYVGPGVMFLVLANVTPVRSLAYRLSFAGGVSGVYYVWANGVLKSVGVDKVE